MAVTLAPACVRLLGVEHGGTVQVVPHPSGKVIIAPMRMRVGVASELVAAAREVIALRRQLARARQRLRALPVRQLSRGFNAGFLKAYRAELMDVGLRMDALTRAVEELRWYVEPVKHPAPATTDARQQIDAAAARFGPGVGFGLASGTVADEVPRAQ